MKRPALSSRRGSPLQRGRQRQRGVATLVIVAVLFFVLSLVAAYTNRSMIFEQRTASNQYRSTLAFEAAEAGIEWVLSQLNSGRIDDDCVPSVDTAELSFRERYLTIDPASGVVTPTGTLDADRGSDLWPTCVFDGTDWTCSCPQDPADPSVAAPAGTDVFPAFRVRFVRPTPLASGDYQPGIVRLEVNGCTRLDDTCLDYPSQSVGGEGRATVRTLLALRGGMASPPMAAITAWGDVDAGGLSAYNANASNGGITVLARGAVSSAITTGTTPGTPGSNTQPDDPGLNALPDGEPERLFFNTFSTRPTTYGNQPGAVVLGCGGACTAEDVRTAASLNPGRVIWVDGGLTLDTGGDLGTADEPVLLVVNGDVNVSVDVYGLIYNRSDDWVTSGASVIRGAVVTQGDLTGTGAFTTVYDADILTRLRWTTGSFVRVPGGWKDF